MLFVLSIILILVVVVACQLEYGLERKKCQNNSSSVWNGLLTVRPTHTRASTGYPVAVAVAVALATWILSA